MVEVLLQTFLPIIGHITKIKNFPHEVGEIIFFVMLPINW